MTGAVGSGRPGVRAAGLLTEGGERNRHHIGALLSESSNLHARRMCNVHFQRAMDVRVESKRVAKPADIFVVAQSQMRGVWIQVPTLCMSVLVHAPPLQTSRSLTAV